MLVQQARNNSSNSAFEAKDWSSMAVIVHEGLLAELNAATPSTGRERSSTPATSERWNRNAPPLSDQKLRGVAVRRGSEGDGTTRLDHSGREHPQVDLAAESRRRHAPRDPGREGRAGRGSLDRHGGNRAQQVLSYQVKHDAALEAVDTLRKATPWADIVHPERFDDEHVRKHWRARYSVMADVIETPASAYQMAMFRETNPLAPCKTGNSGKKKTGARGAAIWLTAVEYPRKHPKETS
jgi:hypothetical protein